MLIMIFIWVANFGNHPLDNGNLRNYENVWISNDRWILEKAGRREYHIKNLSQNTTLGITHGGKIIEEKLEAGKVGQLWNKGRNNSEGYFNLKSLECQNLMTAISSSDLKIKGM